MSSTWPKLTKPPVDVALFQIKYDLEGKGVDIFLPIENEILKVLPKRVENFTADISLPGTYPVIGQSLISSKTKRAGYTYHSIDQKQKLSLDENGITYTDENTYKGWDNFKMIVCNFLTILSQTLNSINVTRTSIRFINHFDFDLSEDPTDFFRTTIATTEDDVIPYASSKYGFKLLLNIDDNIYSIVNHNLDKRFDKYIYIFDIDVLDKGLFNYDIDLILSKIEALRTIKNTIFFGNLTDKTIERCK
mgnify:CR=1 FL=1